VHVIKSYGGDGEQPAVTDSSLISALDRGERSDARSGYVTSGTDRKERWVEIRVSQFDCETN
jgi:hypothetical protein